MANEAYELVISGTLAGQFVQTVMHVNVNNTADTNPYLVAQDLLNTLDSVVDFWTTWCAALPSDYRITSLRCRRILVGGGPTAIMLGGALTEDTGQRSGSIQSAQVNPVLVLLTTLRPNRPGRVFMPGLSETDCDDMQLTSGIITAYEAVIFAIVDPFVTAGFTYNASFGIYRRGIAASDDISAGRISPLIGTQRRRLHPV